MAITRTQIARQLYKNGRRVGLKGGADAATESFGASVGYSGPDGSTGRPDKDFNIDSQGNVSFTPSGSKKDSKAPPPKPPITKDNFKKPNKFLTPSMAVLSFLGKKISGSKLAMLNNKMQRNNYLATLTPEQQVEALEDLAAIGIGTDNPMGIDRNIERGMEDRGLFGTGIGGGEFITDIDVGGPEAKAVLGSGYTDYLDRNKKDFEPDGISDPCKGPNPPAYCFTGLRSASAATPEVEEDDEIINYRLMSNGGSTNDISLQEAKDMAPKGEFLAYINKKEANMLKEAGGSGIMTNAGIPSFVEYGGQSGFEGAKSTGSVQGDVDRGPGGGGGPKGPPTNVGGGVTNLTSKKDIFTPNTNFTKFDVKDLINLGLVDPNNQNTQLAMITDQQKSIIDKQGNIGKLTGAFDPDATFEAAKGAFDKETNTYGFDDKGEKNIFSADRPAEPMTRQEFDAYVEEKGYATGGRIGLMEGGMPYEGGIMDLESSRQMYGLGKLVKKVTRSVKKIAKSPIGKAALLYAGGSYLSGMGAFGNLRGAGFLKSPAIGFKNFMMGKPLGFKDLGKVARGPGFLDKIGGKVGAGILGTSALSYFMTPEEEEEQKLLAKGADIDDVDTIINNPYEYTNPRLMAEGGSTEEKEPVAKKVMPLLDMEGQEKDYRETGGFVDMGRMEKADDVPARLSKNEFVFTADAVRNAGDGSVDKGAEVMYNMMKNLESGGDVSEESQGLEGARKMFQTSQRLEEVL
jgi:hypothetical protein